MPVITVGGEIEGSELGPTLSHEHVFIDTSPDYRVPPPFIRDLVEQLDVDLEGPITLKSLGFLRREPQWSLSNQVLDSYEDAVEELGWAKRAGIHSILDSTPNIAGRDPAKLRRVSAALEMPIVTGTGYYRDAFQPAETATMSVDDHEQRMLEEITVGIAGTGVRAGLIGELGTSRDGITPSEERVLIAAGRVQRATNVAVYVHTEGRRHLVLAAIKVLESSGADPGRIHICHINGAPWWKDIVDTGASIGHDCFGSTFSIDSETKMNPTDQERIDDVKAVFDAGLGHRILISNDICMKMRMHKYGGWGYDHIQTNLMPFFAKAGFTDADIDTLFVDNPRRLVETGR